MGESLESWSRCICQKYEGYTAANTEWCCWEWILHQPQQHLSVCIKSAGFSWWSDITKAGSSTKAI